MNKRRTEALDPALKDLLNEAKDVKLIDRSLIRKLINPRPANGHKHTFGHSLIIAGSTGKAGAAIIASKAALKTGCGLVTVKIPPEYENVLLQHLPEAMVFAGEIKEKLSSFTSIAFGPGAGFNEEMKALLFFIVSNFKGPLVIDADGLTILSGNQQYYSGLSGNIILTPHTAEFDRLTKMHSSLKERLETQRRFAKETGATVLLKGQNSTIATNGKLYINTTGNSGMATAGSGDALTGIIASLCAQGYSASSATIIGVYLHGYAGDVAAKELSAYSMIASDLTDRISRFFLKFT